MKRLFFLFFCFSTFCVARAQDHYSVVLSDDKGDVKSSITKKEYFGYLTLQNTSDSLLAITDIELTPFVETASGNPANGAVTLNGKAPTESFSVEAGKTVRLEVRCTFSEVGTYQALFSMNVVTNMRKELVSKKFLVSYAKPSRSKTGKKKPFYQVKSIHTAEGTLGNLSVQMVLEDSAGAGGKIAQIEPVIWRMGEGTELQSTSFGPIPISDDSGPLTSDLEFEGKTKFRTLNLDLSGICQPGRYNGKVYLSSDGAESVTAEFTVTAKRSALYAFIFITLGLVLAYVLRLILSVVQPKLKNKQKVALLLKQARAFKDLKEGESDLLSSYTRQVNHLLIRLDTNTPDDFATQLEVLETKEKLFREWVQARRYVYELRPVVLQATLLPKLQQAKDYIGMAGGQVDKGDEMLLPLRNIENDIRKLVQDYVVAESTKLASNAEKELKAAGVDPALIADLKTEVDAIKDLPANTNLELDALKSAFSSVQGHYCNLLIAEMKERLNDLINSPPPPETSAAEWLQVLDIPRKAIQKAEKTDDLPARIRQVNEAARLLLQGITERLEAHKDNMILKKAANAHISDSEVNEAIDAWKSGTALLTKWSSMEFNAALESSEAVMDTAMKLWHPAETTRSGAEAIAPRLASNRTSEFAASGISRRKSLPKILLPADTDFNMEPINLGKIENIETTLKRLKRYILWSDLVSSVLIFAVCAILGLLILWAPNTTWGSFTDILYAVSWGFGVHTASKPPDVSGDIGKFVRKKVIE
jgi:hypothetical protein